MRKEILFKKMLAGVSKYASNYHKNAREDRYIKQS